MIEQDEDGMYYDTETGFATVAMWRTSKQFILFPTEILKLKEVGPATAAVYGALRFKAGKDGKTDATGKELAKILFTSERAVKYHIKTLKEVGLIAAVTHFEPGKGNRNLYYFLRHPILRFKEVPDNVAP
jgi:DNA-binding MarR family transcriptional regulator